MRATIQLANQRIRRVKLCFIEDPCFFRVLIALVLTYFGVTTENHLAAQEIFAVNQDASNHSDSAAKNSDADYKRKDFNEAGEDRSQKNLALTIKSRQIEVNTDRLYLADLCNCRGDSHACADILGIDLGKAAAPGSQISFSIQDLENIILNQFPQYQITLPEASRIQVNSVVKKITADDVSVALTDLLQKRFQGSSEFKLELRSLTLDRNIKIRPTALTYYFPTIESEVDDASLVSLLISPRKLPVKVLIVTTESQKQEALPDNEIDFNIFTQFRVYRHVPIAIANLKARQVLSTSQIKFDWQESHNASVPFLNEKSDISVYRTKHAISAGQAIRLQDLMDSNFIDRNQVIELVVEGGGLELGGKAKALTEGSVGEPIEVELEATKKKVTAVVIDSSRARIKI